MRIKYINDIKIPIKSQLYFETFFEYYSVVQYSTSHTL